LCQIWGAIGCAVGTAIAVTLANGLAMNIFYQKRLNIDVVEFWKNILHMLSGLIPPALCGIVLVRFVNLYRIPTLLLCILVYAAVYCVSVWLLSMNEYEKQLVSGIVRKVWKR
ncbi:MAG: polysaccharide biosynthesis C-terminal domain-containing protein, partial [Clostridiales bacterium]|nr:polysaccharide biosynthesis C-terminal domain-containing protein [Clostridiales bacterium]